MRGKLGVKERKERERELRSEEIMKKGEKLFIFKGFTNTTMDEIARECELAKGTLYLHFKSKEELLSAIMYNALTEMYELMFKYQSGITDPIERLRMIGAAHFEFYEKHPEHFRLLNEVHTPGNFRPDVHDKRHNLLHERIISIWNLNMGIIKDGIDMGVFKESTDPLEVAISLWSISTAMIAMHDFVKMMSAIDKSKISDMPFAEFDFLGGISLNAKRVIFSIMNNPPADFDQVK